MWPYELTGFESRGTGRILEPFVILKSHVIGLDFLDRLHDCSRTHVYTYEGS